MGTKCTVGAFIFNYEICVVTYCNQAYFGNHVEIYRNIKLLCFVTRSNIVFQTNYTSKISKLTKKEIKFVVTIDGEVDK